MFMNKCLAGRAGALKKHTRYTHTRRHAHLQLADSEPCGLGACACRCGDGDVRDEAGGRHGLGQADRRVDIVEERIHAASLKVSGGSLLL